MKRFLRLFEAITLFACAVAYCRPAHAYVDMGTGSYMLQVSIAAVAGALLYVKLFWAALRERAMAFRLGRHPMESTVSTSNHAR